MTNLKKITFCVPLIMFLGCSSEEKIWYPFPNSFFGNLYTAGPIALTSNINQNKKIWNDIDKLNSSLARMSYAMQLGVPEVNIAWFLPNGEWPDSPTFQFRKLNPNSEESEISKIINLNGYTYDRISENNLLSTAVFEDRLNIGSASYQALLINDLDHSSPNIIKKVLELAEAGILVMYVGNLPSRSTGLNDFQRKDNEIKKYLKKILPLINHMDTPNELIESLEQAGIHPLIGILNKREDYFRSSVRSCGVRKVIYMFNDSASTSKKDFFLDQIFKNIKLLDPYDASIKEFSYLENGQNISINIDPGRSKILLLGHKENLNIEHCWVEDKWENPEQKFFPTVRWWWPGNAVNKMQIEKELRAFKKAKFSSVELQTLTIGLPEKHLKKNEEQIFRVGEKEYFENIQHVFSVAKDLDINIDLTLGSGWSSGGPFIKDFPEKQLIKSEVEIMGPAKIKIKPPDISEPAYVKKTNFIVNKTIGDFDKNTKLEAIIFAKILPSKKGSVLTQLKDVTYLFDGNQITLEVPGGKHKLFFIYQNNVSHNTLGSAYSGSLSKSLVIDHLDNRGTEEFIKRLGELWIEEIYPNKPTNFFIDSFELIGELPWSEKLFDAFNEMHGYSIKPYLPLLFKKNGESKYLYAIFGEEFSFRSQNNVRERVYEDYLLTRQHLFMNEFLLPMKNWINSYDIKLRLQAHGGYGNYLDSYSIADIPESESLFAGGSYDFLKLASSAGNISNKKVISSESFIKIDLNYDRLEMKDYERLAGNAFSAGINHIVFHGYAYEYKY